MQEVKNKQKSNMKRKMKKGIKNSLQFLMNKLLLFCVLYQA